MRRSMILISSLVMATVLSLGAAAGAQETYPPNDDVTSQPPTPTVLGTQETNDLAFTGSDTFPLVRAGLILLAVGGAVVVIAGTRRSRDTVAV
ncbi:MAG: hypothetical protein AAF548_02060 [Actinomycetota bacterium]